jgi:hypothetical protein
MHSASAKFSRSALLGKKHPITLVISLFIQNMVAIAYLSDSPLNYVGFYRQNVMYLKEGFIRQNVVEQNTN